MAETPATPVDFADFYRATLAPLRRYLARLVGCPAEAQDLAHDAYARLYPVICDGEAREPQALLYTTARRLAINRLRHRDASLTQTVDSAALDATVSSIPDIPGTVMARQELAQLERALVRLPVGCRTVLLLCKVERLPHEEIARRLGISRSTVEKRHARALRLLHEALAEPLPDGAPPRGQPFLPVVDAHP
ncbi:MAG TPA: RNA polymerase sigma factor [Opitutaceae bacterium]